MGKQKKKKKMPLRMCLGCEKMKPKREMIRVVRTPDKQVTIDLTGKKSGRGAYVCPDEECINMAIKNKRLEKSLSCSIPEGLAGELKNGE